MAMMTARAALLASLVLSAVACGPNPPAHIFEDVTAASGIDFRLVTGPSGERLVVETMAGGLAWIDFDGDGDFDLYLVNAHSDPLNADEPGKEEDRLYRNDGGGRFTDSTRAAGVGDSRYGMGAAAGDCDGDGDQDLLVTNFGRNTLYRNDGKGAFADATEAAGLVERGFNSSAAWFDMDSDGDLDLYVARYLKYHPRTSRRCREGGIAVSCHPRLFPGESDLLYRNGGDGTFEEVSERAGIDRGGEGEGKGLGVLAFDHDRDGLQDVFVANDTTPNFLYRNRGGGAFEDVAQAAGVALSAEGKALAGMGVDAADADGDALTDIYVTNFALEVNSLYLARPGGRYAEAARRTGLGETYIPLGFGTLFLDADLDGDQDIATANGHINEVVETTDPGTGSTYRQRQDLFLNRGDGTFERAEERTGPFFSAERCVGRGLASSDFDGDGDPDLALMTLDRSLVLLRNENPLGNRSVLVRLAGKGQRDAYGARIEAEVAGRRQAFEHSSARSYLSACDPRVVIGLGKAAAIDRLTVRWPSGKVTELRGVRPGEVRVEEP